MLQHVLKDRCQTLMQLRDPGFAEALNLIIVVDLEGVAFPMADVQAQFFSLFTAVMPGAAEADRGVRGRNQARVFIGKRNRKQGLQFRPLRTGQFHDFRKRIFLML